MARPLRIEFPGAWYHVMNRGAGRRWIYKHDKHYHYFLSLLADTAERYRSEVHAYCLMGNHYHLMLHTPDGNLQRIMRHINGVYTQYFNRTERTDGALFRGRYKAILIDAQTYWLALSRYIHRNPLEAGLVKRLGDYRWSSYSAYLGKITPPEWLVTGEVLGAMGKRKARARYRDYVLDKTQTEVDKHYQHKHLSSIMGNDTFKQAILEGIEPDPDIPESRVKRVRPSIDEILTVVAMYYAVSEKTLLRTTRGRGVISPARAVAMYLSQQLSDKKLSEIAVKFGLSGYSSAGASIRNFKVMMEKNKRLSKDINYILQDLNIPLEISIHF